MKLHTATLNGETRLLRAAILFPLALLACFAAAFPSQAAAPAPLLSSNRFLFIIDASASMKPFDNSVRETVFDLIYSGLRRRMTNGDSYGLWVVRDQNDTSFPMDVWKSRYTVEMGAKATSHVTERGFRGNARLDLALADALRIVKSVGDLTIVLVSNGEVPIAGTPFDDAINARFRELAPLMKRAKLTLNTALVAQNGALVAWAVNSPEFLIDVPYVAPKPKVTSEAPPSVALSPTNAPLGLTNTESIAVVNTNALQAKPRRAASPIIITKDTVAQAKREFAAMTTTVTSEPPALVSVTNTDGAISNSIAVITAIPLDYVPPGIVSTSTTNAIASRPIENAAKDPASKSNSTSAANPIAAAPKPAKANSLESSAPSQALALPAAALHQQPKKIDSNFHPVLWIGIGVAGALACGCLGALVVRFRQHDPSLISQAIAQQRAE